MDDRGTQLIERPQEFKDVEEKIKALKPQLDGFKKAITTATVEGDPEETRRRAELTRYVGRSLVLPDLANHLDSVLEEIERQSQELLAKSTAVRFVDKAGDSGEVVKLVERLGEAIAHYQVSKSWFVASNKTHRWADIATTSDLRSNH